MKSRKPNLSHNRDKVRYPFPGQRKGCYTNDWSLFEMLMHMRVNYEIIYSLMELDSDTVVHHDITTNKGIGVVTIAKKWIICMIKSYGVFAIECQNMSNKMTHFKHRKCMYKTLSDIPELCNIKFLSFGRANLNFMYNKDATALDIFYTALASIKVHNDHEDGVKSKLITTPHYFNKVKIGDCVFLLSAIKFRRS